MSEQHYSEKELKAMADQLLAEDAKKQAEEKARKEKEKEEKARIDPKTMFLGMTEQYSKFDEKVALWHCNDR